MSNLFKKSRVKKNADTGGDALKQNRTELAIGRMKPHFINNALSSIYYLCDSDPKKAQTLTQTLSSYILGVLETFDNPNPVPFSRELDLSRSYLALEKLRFEDRLRVNYDIAVDDFKLPLLTIQPLVENAVKHGISGKDGRGEVRVVTRRLADGVQIRIIDDGIGFDTVILSSEEYRNKGLANVRRRICQEAGGEMSVESSPGKGTTVIITLHP